MKLNLNSNPNKTVYTIGRASDNDLVIADMAVSRKHGIFTKQPDGSWNNPHPFSWDGIIIAHFTEFVQKATKKPPVYRGSERYDEIKWISKSVFDRVQEIPLWGYRTYSASKKKKQIPLFCALLFVTLHAEYECSEFRQDKQAILVRGASTVERYRNGKAFCWYR